MNRNDATLFEADEIAWPKFDAVPETRVLAGAPETSTFVISQSLDSQMGLWQVTPGVFETDHAGYIEFIHIVAGIGRLVSETGTVTELAAGSTTVMPVGWKGRWEVDETLTKVFTILKGDAASFTVHGAAAAHTAEGVR